MRRFHIFQLFTFAVFFLAFLLNFPNTFRWLEGDDLFLFTREYFVNVLEHPQGVTLLITNYLLQFFSTPWLASLIYALLMVLTAEFFYLAMRKIGKGSASWFAVLPAMAIVLVRFPDIAPTIYMLCSALFLWGYSVISNRIARCIYVLVMPVVAAMFMPWGIAAILFLGMAAIECLIRKNKIHSAVMLLAVAECVAIPAVWSSAISFVPFEVRPFESFGDDITWKMMVTHAVTFALLAVPRSVNFKHWINYVIVAVAGGAFYVILTNTSFNKFIERVQKVTFMADDGDWTGILAELTYQDYPSNKAFLRYSLLAESAVGTLPQNLMNYPISSPEDFLFRHETKSYLMNLNRQFYHNIGVWDEAFHQAFEYGVNARENECFLTLRYKTDYAIATHDLGTAETYVILLKRTSYNQDFVATRAARIDSLKQVKRPERPYRSDTFTGAYLLPSEFFRLLSCDLKNRKILDYLLCSLLLNKEVEKFGIILKNFNLYEGENLPKVYAEAVAALATRDTTARNIGRYDHNLEQQYIDFVTKAKSGGNCSQYSGTYWWYLLYRELPEQPNFNK